MTETLTFATIKPAEHNIMALNQLGGGAVPEMAAAFGHDLATGPSVVENYGYLIGAVGRHKELQANITGVQTVLGTDQSAVELTRGWAERTGLLIPVERSFMTGEALPSEVDVALISGGVRNWMERRRKLLTELKGVEIGRVLLAAGRRQMKTSEGPDVRDGMTEADYLKEVVKPQIDDLGLTTEMLAVESEVGDEVMAKAAERIRPADDVLYVGNAGQVVLGAGQLRRAVQGLMPGFDQAGDQLFMVSGKFQLGTGNEPTATHQNPFTALGQIARNVQELARHMS
jgi:hypothetical protein